MEEYNDQTLQKYLDSRNYEEAANYLEKFQAKSIPDQNILNSKIRDLRKRGEKEKAFKSKLDKTGLEAYDFVQGLDGNGAIPHLQYNENNEPIPDTANRFGDKYTEIVRNLNVSNPNSKAKGRHIDYIDIEIHDDYFNTFLNRLGLTDIKDNQLGLNYRIKEDGKHIVSVPTNNRNLTKVFNTAYSLKNVSLIDRLGKNILSDQLKGTAIGAGAGIFTGPGIAVTAVLGYLAGTVSGGIRTLLFEDEDVDAVQFKASGNGFSNVNINERSSEIKNLYQLCKITDDARNKANKDLENVGTTEIHEEMVVSEYFGSGDVQLQEALNNNIIDKSTYLSIRKERKAKYDDLLSKVDLTQERVWAITDDTDDIDEKKGLVMEELTKSSDKVNLMKDLQIALQQGTVDYSVAIRGGEIGTYINIKPKEEGKTDIKWNRIFVPGLFKSTCDATIKADTKFMSYSDCADMKRWNYGKRLHDGTYIGHCKDYEFYKVTKDDNGREIKQAISEEEALHSLNRENIIDSCVSAALQDLYVNESYEHTDALIRFNVKNAINELYPVGTVPERERLYQFNKMYNTILKLANYKQQTNNRI